MKLSVLDLAPVFQQADAAYALQQAVILAQTAEKLGYSRYWVAEHHDMPGLACTSPEILLAHIGAYTKQIRLGSGALLLPHYKPMKVAESFHMLATLYPDRIDLGIGRAPGGSAQASIALSGNFLENVRQVPDSLQALLALLDNRYELEGQPVTARPLPARSPEVWLLGTNKKSADFAAKFGTGFVFGQFMSDRDPAEIIASYREQFQPSSRLPEPQVIAAVGVICGETEAEARGLAAEGAHWFKPPEAEASQLQARNDSTSDQPDPRLFVGTGEQVRVKLEAFGESCGVNEFLIVNIIPDYVKRLRSYELLAAEILI
ncbi:LLM class flavin-dependent oxidoreductase [Paenibacillus sp. SI8]|uniref:LLM class flavin-dependent oxidoreductase n=1 Tax=unclassified Paenibacillus TaxID=185978 RepID=UPI003467B39D